MGFKKSRIEGKRRRRMEKGRRKRREGRDGPGACGEKGMSGPAQRTNFSRCLP
jgi:hypothetical protein